MSQNDFNIANQGFPSFRSDLNSALQALASTSSGDTEPATTYANQLWYDTAENVLKIRNEANSVWLDALTALGVTSTAAELNVLDGVTASTAEINQLDGLEVYGKTNILGTVSQAGGVPTGAVIERGSNANGEYVKFADGTLICTYAENITPVANTYTSYTWTYPAAFVANPTISTTANSASSTVKNTQYSDRSSTSVKVGIVRENTTNTTVDATALGRWF